MKFLDLSREYEYFDYASVLNDVFENTSFINGPQVKEFEEICAKRIGVEYAVAVCSGTSALEMAILSLGLDRPVVLTTPYTFIATTEVPVRLGCRVVFCDIDENFNINMDHVKKMITTGQLDIFIPVHLFGLPCDIDEECVNLCKEYGVKIIEDCAQSFGSLLHFDHLGLCSVGSIGDFGCFSFFPAKNLGCPGDGGIVTTSSLEIYERLLMIRNHGSKTKYLHEIHGGNFRMDTIHAAILIEKIKYLDVFIAIRRQAAEAYNEGLKEIDSIILPKEKENTFHTYNQYVLQIKNNERDKLRNFLAEFDIPTAIYYPRCLSEQPCYSGYDFQCSCEKSKQMARENLALPIAYLTEEEVQRVIRVTKSFFNKKE